MALVLFVVLAAAHLEDLDLVAEPVGEHLCTDRGSGDEWRSNLHVIPGTDQKHLVETMVGIMHQLMKAIRPGVKVKTVGELGDKLSFASGYSNEVLKTNWPYYGHSNGCMWEAPYIEPRLCTDADVFEENMVASVEGFYTSKTAGTAR